MAEIVKPRKLQAGQLVVLNLLYKYRFASIDLLQATLNTKPNSALYRSDTDMMVYATTKNALFRVSPEKDLIWSNIKEPDEPIALVESQSSLTPCSGVEIRTSRQ